MAAGGDMRMSVFGSLNDEEMDNHKVEEGLSKMRGGKA